MGSKGGSQRRWSWKWRSRRGWNRSSQANALSAVTQLGVGLGHIDGRVQGGRLVHHREGLGPTKSGPRVLASSGERLHHRTAGECIHHFHVRREPPRGIECRRAPREVSARDRNETSRRAPKHIRRVQFDGAVGPHRGAVVLAAPVMAQPQERHALSVRGAGSHATTPRLHRPLEVPRFGEVLREIVPGRGAHGIERDGLSDRPQRRPAIGRIHGRTDFGSGGPGLGAARVRGERGVHGCDGPLQQAVPGNPGDNEIAVVGTDIRGGQPGPSRRVRRVTPYRRVEVCDRLDGSGRGPPGIGAMSPVVERLDLRVHDAPRGHGSIRAQPGPPPASPRATPRPGRCAGHAMRSAPARRRRRSPRSAATKLVTSG